MKRVYLFLTFLIFIKINNLYSILKIDNINKLIHLTNWTYLESEYEPGNYTIDHSDYEFKEYDNRFLRREKNFKRSMYTFKSYFILDGSLKDRDISLFHGPAFYPCNIYLNGSLIIIRGNSDISNYVSFLENSVSVILPKTLLNYNDTNILIVQAYPIYENSPFEGVIISSYENITRLTYYKNLFKITLIFSIVFISYFFCFYFLLLFINSNFKLWYYLYFSLICLSFSFAYFNIAYFYESHNEIFAEKIARISFQFLTYFFLIFIFELTNILNKNKLLKLLLLIPALILSFIVINLKDKKSIMLFFNNVITNYYITPLLLLEIVILLISSIKYKKKESLIILLANIVVIFASLRDIYYLNNGVFSKVWLVPYGYFLVLISIFIILVIEQSNNYKIIEQKTIDLDNKNRTLSDIFENIKNIMQKIDNSRVLLETKLQETVNILNKLEMNNKNISLNLDKQFDNIDSIIQKTSERIKTSGEKLLTAIKNQTKQMEEINISIEEINKRIEESEVISRKTVEFSQNFSKIADESKKVLSMSRESIQKIKEFSVFIKEVLSSIQEIAEQTSLLSMNASIEATKAGQSGKGFSIVANEIRKLANQSKENLKSSMEKLKDINETIRKNLELSEMVSNSLNEIIELSKQSVQEIIKIDNSIKNEKEQASQILEGAKKLMNEVLFIKNLSIEENSEFERTITQLNELKNIFVSIIEILLEQSKQEKAIVDYMNSIRELMSQNFEDIKLLDQSINK